MRDRQLEYVMRDFYHQRYHVLVCTTIIESGIDIPTANTIIIDRADKFGLAQLHQLRGRVGRSHHQAYAYLLTPPETVMTTDATKRLDAIQSMSDLGAGFILATHDLEIRGAGALLGEEQSGHIQAVGFELYMELLQRTISALQQDQPIPSDFTKENHTEIDLKVTAIIPESYMPDVHMRLIFYKRIANTTSQHGLDELQIEMIDRFGLMPDPIKNLLHTTALKLQLLPLGIRKLEATATGGWLEFTKQAAINPQNIIKLMHHFPERFALSKPDRLSFTGTSDTIEQRINVVNDTINTLKKHQVFSAATQPNNLQ